MCVLIFEKKTELWLVPVPWWLTLKSGDGARLGEERSEVRTVADDRVHGEAAEVPLP
jgi:hypothetical protein